MTNSRCREPGGGGQKGPPFRQAAARWPWARLQSDGPLKVPVSLPHGAAPFLLPALPHRHPGAAARAGGAVPRLGAARRRLPQPPQPTDACQAQGRRPRQGAGAAAQAAPGRCAGPRQPQRQQEGAPGRRAGQRRAPAAARRAAPAAAAAGRRLGTRGQRRRGGCSRHGAPRRAAGPRSGPGPGRAAQAGGSRLLRRARPARRARCGQGQVDRAGELPGAPAVLLVLLGLRWLGRQQRTLHGWAAVAGLAGAAAAAALPAPHLCSCAPPWQCHENFLLELGPRVNLITGPNGAGKSAVLQALQCALGARAAETGR